MRRILIVEDHPDTRDVMRLLLRREGHEVQTASEGNEALELSRTFQPEIILLDIGLPGLSGYDLARRLRTISFDQRPILVAITGYGQAEDRARAVEAGFDHHLLKPVAPEILIDLVQSL